MVPTTKQLLSRTSYGQDFADAATTDTVHVSFEGEDYDVEIRGVRDGARRALRGSDAVADGYCPFVTELPEREPCGYASPPPEVRSGS